MSATQEAESEEKSLGVAHAKLSLDCLTEADAGYYECVAEQGQKTESVASEVHVVSKLTILQTSDGVRVKNISEKAKNPHRCSKFPLHKNFNLNLEQNVVIQTYPKLCCRSQKCLVQSLKKAILFSKLTFSGYGAGTCSKAVPHTTAPKISQYYTTFMMEMGLDAHLKCLTVGKHSTEWLGPDDESLPVNSDKYQILPDGSLIIKTLTFDDMGVYQCMVKNSYGHDMAETFVYPVAVSTQVCSDDVRFCFRLMFQIHEILVENPLLLLLDPLFELFSVFFF